MELGSRSTGLLELMRPVNALAAGLLTFTGSFVAGGAFGRPLAVVAAVVATVTATAAGNAVNDYFDRDVDRVNRPDRPIPRGTVTPREALRFSALLGVVAMVAAVLLPKVAIAIAVVNLLALIAYTKLFKGLPGVGNVVVASLTGSTFLFGGAAVGDVFGAGTLAVLAGVATLTREIVKDVEDIAGDETEGLRTLPIVVGERRALWVGVVAIAIAVAASVVPYFESFGLAYLLVVVPADAVMLHAACLAFRDPATAQRRLKLGMFVAAAAFIVGRATTLVTAV